MSVIKNPIKYVSRTFLTILNDINSDSELVDKPVWWKRIWAGIGDVLSMWLNAEANNRTLRTAFTRSSVKDLCELIDYELQPHSTSSGNVLFYFRTDLGTSIFPFTVAKSDLVANSEGSLNLSSLRFESRNTSVTFSQVSGNFTTDFATDNILDISTDLVYSGHKIRFTTTNTLPTPLQANKDYYVIYVSATEIKLSETLEGAYSGNEITISDNGTGTHSWVLYSGSVEVYQQETKESTTIGESDGVTEWQEFDLPESFVLENTLVITINSVEWAKVETFVESGSSDKHYKIFPKDENQFAIRFGNGTYGKIPESFSIDAAFAFGGGSDSNVTVKNKINSYAGTDSNLNGVSNPLSVTGGSNEESIESAKRLAPLLLKARGRFVTSGDGEALTLAYGGISYVKCLTNDFGVLSANMFCVANGGGLYVDTGNELRDYLTNLTSLEEIDVRVNENVALLTVNVVSAVKVLSNFSYSNIESFVELAYLLFLTETGTEIVNEYNDNGITSTITLINTIFSKSFSTTDQNTIDQIDRLVANLTPAEPDIVIQESDILGYIDSFVNGVDYVTISTFGTGLPLTVSDHQITTPGTIGLSEIT